VLSRVGHMPLPLILSVPDEDSDQEALSTVYNQKPEGVAAPTAGFAFCLTECIEKLEGKRDRSRLSLACG